MVKRPFGLGAFEFAVMSGLRAGQLARGCTPRVDGDHKCTTTAQMEVAARKVTRAIDAKISTSIAGGAG